MDFRLRTPVLDFYVDVRARNFDGRCIAVADIAGDQELGLGLTPAEAIAAALSPLGRDAASALLAGRKFAGLTGSPTDTGDA